MSHRTLLGLALSIGLAIVFGARTTRATLLVHSPAVDRAARGGGVIVGRIESTQAAWSGARIVTRSIVTTEKVLVGTFSPRYEIVTPGGTVDGIGMRVLGGAELQRGTRAVLFLSREASANGSGHVLDLADGALVIEHGADGVDRVQDAGRTRTVEQLAAELAR